MSDVRIQTNPKVKLIFGNYPNSVRKKMLYLRKLILATAKEMEQVTQLEETLKWGEPSYLTKNGSTIRIAWKTKKPHQYAIYFQCTSRLVPTFRIVYKNVFQFDGKRAIVFHIDQTIPKEALKDCIKAALHYHKVKKLPTLGI